MTSDDPAALVAFANARAEEGGYRDALAALDRAGELDDRGRHASKIRPLRSLIEKKSVPEARALLKRMAAENNDSWVKEFVEFRTRFEFTDTALSVQEAYRKLRRAHQEPAEKLYFAARRDFQSKNKEAGYRKYEEIVAKHFASSWYRYAKSSLERRGK